MSSSFYQPRYQYEYEARHVFRLNGRPLTFIAKHETLLFTRVNQEATVANDLCIKAGHGCK